jgi:hypothetical protein
MDGPLNFSQFVEGRRWWPWAREGLKEAHVFAGDEPCTGKETYRASARFYATKCDKLNDKNCDKTQHVAQFHPYYIRNCLPPKK